MSTRPTPLLHLLLNAQETPIDTAGLRFLVATGGGFRTVPIEAIQALIPDASPIAALVDNTDDERRQDERLASLEQRVAELTTTIGDVAETSFDLGVQIRELDHFERPAFRPDESVAIGTDALLDGAVDRENVAVGLSAGKALEGAGNVLIGAYAGHECDGALTDVTAVGHQALRGSTSDLENTTVVGAYAHATGSHQVVLGDHRTNLNTLSAPHRRSDARDMHAAEPLSLGLDFVLNVQPVQYREDFREAYIDWASKPTEPLPPREPPSQPTAALDDPNYQAQVIAYRSTKAIHEKEVAEYERARQQYFVDLGQWITDNRLARIKSDGTHAGARTHVGFSAQQLAEVAKHFKMDLALVQDHSVAGGESVKTHSDSEMLAVLWRAVQQLYAQIHSSSFIDTLQSALHQRQIDETSASDKV